MLLPQTIQLWIDQANYYSRLITRSCENLNGKVTKIPMGKYKGRWGSVQCAKFESGAIMVRIFPFNYNRKDGIGVVTYHSLQFFDIVTLNELKDPIYVDGKLDVQGYIDGKY